MTKYNYLVMNFIHDVVFSSEDIEKLKQFIMGEIVYRSIALEKEDLNSEWLPYLKTEKVNASPSTEKKEFFILGWDDDCFSLLKEEEVLQVIVDVANALWDGEASVFRRVVPN